MPGIYNYFSGQLEPLKIREVQIEDLLGRDPINLDIDEVAGGSIGSELCRQICRFNPEKLILVGRGENSIFDIEQELRSTCPDINLLTEILDVRDREKVELVFRKYKPGVVFHAAAHKHVPLMERNPEEALKNNIVGTYNVAEISDLTGVKTFVLISTDKAINPSSIMGATKRVTEMISNAFRGRALWKCSRESRKCYSDVQEADCQGWPRYRDSSRNGALLYDHTRGNATRDPSRCHGQG